MNQIKANYGVQNAAPQQIYKKGGTYAKSWKAAGTEVALCTIQGQGHGWPGGSYGKLCDEKPFSRACRNYKEALGPMSMDFTTSKEILRWFNQHHL